MPQLNPEVEPVTVLVADDDAVTRRLLQHHLSSAGYQPLLAADGSEALQKMHDDCLVALLDLQMPGSSGLECLQTMRKKWPDTQVVMISGEGDIEDAVKAMKHGAVDYLTKPFEPDRLLTCIRQAVRNAKLARDNRSLRQVVGGQLPPVEFVAESSVAKDLLSSVRKAASLEVTVLILGPSGTGKSTLARMMHQLSPRAKGPFISVSCANLPRDLIEGELFGHEKGAYTGADSARPGWVELAHQGTLFLDEIGDLPLELQPKLLTFLQEKLVRRLGGTKTREVDVRVIAATNKDLREMVSQKMFREDLYHRLAVVELPVPPLENRHEDIARLAEVILERISLQRGQPAFQLNPKALAKLNQHSWPGNVRELENVLERTTVFCSGQTIEPEDILFQTLPNSPTAATPGEPNPPSLAGKTWEEIEQLAIRQTLQEVKGNRAAAARMLGISERSLYNKINKYGLSD